MKQELDALKGRAIMKRKTAYLLLAVVALVLAISAIGLWINTRAETRAREAVLRQNLNTMRMLIDEFAKDQHRRPNSLEELVEQGYMREIPVDPVTVQKNWKMEIAEEANSVARGRVIRDVRSNAVGRDGQGVPYSEY
jgi:general secretion pathway protein G